MAKKKPKIALSHEILAGIGVCATIFIGAIFIYQQAFAEDVSITARVLGPAMTVTIDSVRPQGRVGADQTNSDTTFYLTVRTANDADDVVLFTQVDLATTDVAGVYAAPAIPLTGLTPGTYDIGLKGQQHLTRVLNDIVLVAGNNVLNFSQPDNSAPRGDQVLLTGDVNDAGTDPATLGDDVVNSVDISTLLVNIDDDDVTGNAIRANLNQDIVVNSVDLSWMIGNLDGVGDN
ncbi:hypothetical protein KJ611_02935 [Patescibacteria group bacterium]|nr:hypothetical protein [Patescibacteria group bacterium]MBU1705237.1 hypothetical protein [Patescibacteria group bacterium]